jgi:2-polyprenyl-6-methoxyphenol hydroxylase-like FAD-dependent oxidoreductase
MAIETVAVVGGGIGGLASAIFLSRCGFQVTVYDKAKHPQPVGAGFLLQPPGQMILQKLGVLQDILKVSVPIAGLQSRTVSGHTLLNLEYSRLKGESRQGLGVQRSTIYDALLERVDLCCIDFVLNKRVLIASTTCRPTGGKSKGVGKEQSAFMTNP